MWPPSEPWDSDARGYDAWRDELASPWVEDPDYVPPFRHGLVVAPPVAATYPAAAPVTPQTGPDHDASGGLSSPPDASGPSSDAQQPRDGRRAAA